MLLNLVLFTYSHAQIHEREHDEDKSLYQRYEQVQTKKDDRKQDRHQRKERQRDHVTGKHIGVKTDGERKNAGKVAHHFNQKHQWRQRPHRADELLDVAMALNAQPVKMIVDKSQKSATQRDGRAGRGRFKSWNQSEQIAQQDEIEKRNGIRDVALITVSHYAVGLLGDELFGSFNQMLQAARLLH